MVMSVDPPIKTINKFASVSSRNPSLLAAWRASPKSVPPGKNSPILAFSFPATHPANFPATLSLNCTHVNLTVSLELGLGHRRCDLSVELSGYKLEISICRDSMNEMARLDFEMENTRGSVVMDLDPDSCSKSVNETVNGSHEYTIKGYSLAKGMGIGKYLASDTFSVGGYQWAIYFYPDGKNPEDSPLYVSVFIALASEGTDVRALFELTLIDQSGKGKHKVHTHFDRPLESGPYTLKYKGSMWGYKRFFKRSALEVSDYIKDDSLTMHCTVGVVRTRIEGPKQYTIPIPPSDVGHCFKELLESGLGSDITFEVCDETFRAHKLVLAARSPVFRAHFFGLIGNPNTERVVVEDMEPPVFKAMLHFIYSDALPDPYELTGSGFMCTYTIMVQHLLAAADRYGLDRLKILCEAKLCDEVSADTVATTLSLAEQHHSAQLKSVCLKFAAAPANLGAVMKSEGFHCLEETCPTLLSALLETVAIVNCDPSSKGRKKSMGSTPWLSLADGTDSIGRRTRRRHS